MSGTCIAEHGSRANGQRLRGYVSGQSVVRGKASRKQVCTDMSRRGHWEARRWLRCKANLTPSVDDWLKRCVSLPVGEDFSLRWRRLFAVRRVQASVSANGVLNSIIMSSMGSYPHSEAPLSTHLHRRAGRWTYSLD